MQRNVNSLEEKVEEIYDYQIEQDEVEKSLLILKISLGETISEKMGLQKKIVKAGTIARFKVIFTK